MKDDRDNTPDRRRYEALKDMYEASCSGDEFAAVRFENAKEDYDSTFPWEGMGS